MSLVCGAAARRQFALIVVGVVSALAAWAPAESLAQTPPETTITAGPSGAVPVGPITFSFTSSGSDSSFECQLDGWARWQPCSSPQTYPNLAPGDRTFWVRATDAAGNTDATPASRSFTVDTTPSIVGAPPSGTVVQADYMTRVCPIDGLWGAVSDADYYAQSCSDWSDADDPQINYFSEGGSPMPGQDGKVHPGYRRLRLTDGMQSKYDATCRSGSPCNDAYRTQLISNSDTRTYYPMVPGHRYVWWLAVRFQSPTPLTGNGSAQDSQVFQIKNQGSSCHASGTYRQGPVESLTEGQTALSMKNRQGPGDVRTDSVPIGGRGVWQVLALDIYYSPDLSKSAYRLWQDADGDATLDPVPVTPKIIGRVTAVGPDCIGKPSIGPYQPMSVPAVSRDYGVNEMVEVPVGADWE